jgi:DNA replication regulator SLD3
LPRFKRELSEIALSTIPPARPTLQHTKRREVDLTAASQATEAKLQKKAAIEKELQNAITALKRPNPRMAVKDFVEASDKRSLSGPQSRKSKNPVRNVLGQAVQVMATPKVNRKKDMYPDLPLPRLSHHPLEPEVEPEAIPPSSIPRIPSSSIKSPLPPTLHFSPPDDNDTIPASISRPKSSSTLQPFNHVIANTPSRPKSSSALQPFNHIIANTPSHRPSKHPHPFPDIDPEAEDELSLPHDSPALPPLPKDPFVRPLGLPRMSEVEASSPLKGLLGLPRIPTEMPRTPSRKAKPRRWAGPVRGMAGGKGRGVVDKERASSPPGRDLEGGKGEEGKGDEVEEVDIYKQLGWDDVDELM